MQLLGDWSVDRDTAPSSKPAWITLTDPVAPIIFNGTDANKAGVLTLAPTNTEIGSYAVRIKYKSPVNSGTVDATFIVDVYPTVDYSFTAPTTTCVGDIYPLTFGNYANIMVLDSDYDSSS